MLPPLYNFSGEKTIIEMLDAHKTEQTKKAKRIEVARLERQLQRVSAAQPPTPSPVSPPAVSSANTGAPRPLPGMNNGMNKLVFLVRSDDPEAKLHPVSCSFGARVDLLYHNIPPPYDNAQQWQCTISFDGRPLTQRDALLDRVGIGEGAILQLTAVHLNAPPHLEMVNCESCGAPLSLKAYAEHDCPALKTSTDNAVSDSIPCEKCGALVPAALYLNHINRCKGR